jgi:hypothetical protein
MKIYGQKITSKPKSETFHRRSIVVLESMSLLEDRPKIDRWASRSTTSVIKVKKLGDKMAFAFNSNLEAKKFVRWLNSDKSK